MPEDSRVKDVVLMLGSFHTLMNLMGAIGTLLDGSGIKEILGTIYGDNAVQHIMTGKAVQRAVRVHLLLDQYLTQQVADKVLCDNPGCADLLQELEQLYARTLTGDSDLNSVITSTCLVKLPTSCPPKEMDYPLTLAPVNYG